MRQGTIPSVTFTYEATGTGPRCKQQGIHNNEREASEAKPLSGEAPPALLAEGVLNPDNCSFSFRLFSCIIVQSSFRIKNVVSRYVDILILLEGLYYNTGLSKAGVAQQAEQLICNQQVAGSSPITSSEGEVPERPKGADCKSVVSDFGGSNPPLSTI